MTEYKAEKSNVLGTGSIPGLMLKYALPSVVSMVVMALYNIVDQIFIGQGVGYLGNTATTVSFPLVTLGLAIALLMGQGAAALISLELGRGRGENTGRVLGNALLTLAFLGVALSVFAAVFMRPMLLAFGATALVMPYAVEYTGVILLGLPFSMLATAMSHSIRADGSPRYSMLSTLSGALLNTVLDPVFIFVFKAGVRGAAIATVIAQVLSFVISFYYLVRRAKYVRITLRHLQPDFKTIKTIAAYGSSNFANHMAMFIVTLVINNTFVKYGGMSSYGSEIPLAAFGIISKINMILISVVVGISHGMQPILGFNYGAGNYSRVKATLRLGVFVSGATALIVNMLFIFAPGMFIAVFGDSDPAFNEFASHALRTFMSCVFCAGIQIPCSLFFIATGRPLKAMTLQLTRSVFLLIPLVLVLPLFFGLDGVLYASPVSDVLALCVTSCFILNEVRHMGEKTA